MGHVTEALVLLWRLDHLVYIKEQGRILAPHLFHWQVEYLAGYTMKFTIHIGWRLKNYPFAGAVQLLPPSSAPDGTIPFFFFLHQLDASGLGGTPVSPFSRC